MASTAPSPLETLPGQPVTFAKRIGCGIIDGLVLGPPSFFTGGLHIPLFIGAVLFMRGRSPGKLKSGVHVLDYRTGKPASYWRILIREIGGKLMVPLIFWLALLRFGDVPTDASGENEWVVGIYLTYLAGTFLAYYLVNLAFVLVDPAGRALWDKAAGTVLRFEAVRRPSSPPDTLSPSGTISPPTGMGTPRAV